MFRTRWVNETGNEWFGSTYTYIEDAQIGAKCYFEDNDPDDVTDDIVQIWEVDEDGDTVSVTAAEEYCITDFIKA